MPPLNNPLKILKILDKSNCGDCGKSTCLAFAAAVFKGERQLDECPKLENDAIEKFGGGAEKRATVEQDLIDSMEKLKKEIASIDLSCAAQRVGARFFDDKLTVKVCGKDFGVDSKGNLSSDIHIHPWIAIPILNYIIYSSGIPVSGNWVPFRELKSGRIWCRLFEQRCEKPLKKIADEYTDLFEDILHIFNGRQVENHYTSDISLVLYPLPRMPILICYWNPADGLDSNLNMFFDSTAEDNLNIESIYALGTGLVRMFEKIALRHEQR